jgi:histidinol-phosphate aminotransferase
VVAAHPGRLVIDAVRAISPYVPGKPISELERELGIRNIIKLASNENPWGPSPGALAAMRAAVDDVWLYPDGSAHTLRAALARELGVSVDCITLGNGSNELLVLLAEACLTPAHNAVYSEFAFAIYPLAIQATGAAARIAPSLAAESDMPLGHDLAAMARLIDANTRLVFIANPNNPTGTWLPPSELKSFVAEADSNTLVVLDEAYFEYARSSGISDGVSWLGEFPNLVVLRTFSKAWGLAGARVGYAVSHPEIAAELNKLRAAFNVNLIAQAGAVAALEDRAHMESCVAKTNRELRFMQRELKARGLRIIPSVANFVLVHFGPQASKLNDALLRAGVIVRPVTGYGLPEYLRITVGKHEQNQRLLALLDIERGRSW